MRISYWSSDVCSSDLPVHGPLAGRAARDRLETVLPEPVPRRHGLPGRTGRPRIEGARAHPPPPRRPFAIAGPVAGARKAQPRPRVLLRPARADGSGARHVRRSEEHTFELKPLMRTSYAV